jgi:hypothetical protein
MRRGTEQREVDIYIFMYRAPGAHHRGRPSFYIFYYYSSPPSQHISTVRIRPSSLYTTLNMMQYIYSQGIYSDCSFKCSRVTVGILGYRADPANQCRSQNRAVSGKLLLLEPLLNDIKIDPEREGGGQ